MMTDTGFSLAEEILIRRVVTRLSATPEGSNVLVGALASTAYRDDASVLLELVREEKGMVAEELAMLSAVMLD